jgi:hypothetical protein
MRLNFIGGASGGGKTAVMPYLKELLGDGIAVYDFDDIGAPEGADKKWCQESTEKWLQKLLSEGKDACLLGQIVLRKILSCPSAKKIDKIIWKGHAFAVKVNHQKRIIHCIGGIECGFELSHFRLRSRATATQLLNKQDWKKAWLILQKKLPRYTQTYGGNL